MRSGARHCGGFDCRRGRYLIDIREIGSRAASRNRSPLRGTPCVSAPDSPRFRSLSRPLSVDATTARYPTLLRINSYDDRHLIKGSRPLRHAASGSPPCQLVLRSLKIAPSPPSPGRRLTRSVTSIKSSWRAAGGCRTGRWSDGAARAQGRSGSRSAGAFCTGPRMSCGMSSNIVQAIKQDETDAAGFRWIATKCSQIRRCAQRHCGSRK